MASIDIFTFVAEAPKADGKFRIGRKQSLLRDGVEFTVKDVIVGHWLRNGATVVNDDDNVQQIQLICSVGDEQIPLNRILNGRRVVYDNLGKAEIVSIATFGETLKNDLIEKFGRSSSDERCLNAPISDIANYVKSWFAGKTLVVTDRSNFAKNDQGRLVPGSPCAVFSIKD